MKLDAIGRTIDDLGKTLSNTSAAVRPDQNAIATSGGMTIRANDAASFCMTEESFKSSKGALSGKMSAVRRRRQGDTHAATVHDAEAPLDSLREEEERKDNE